MLTPSQKLPKDTILLMDLYLNHELTLEELQSEYQKLNIHSCFTCEHHDKHYSHKICINCIRNPVKRIFRDNWTQRKISKSPFKEENT